MVMTPKIATCCYCGTRAALRLDHDRHELTCRSCGAPLRNLKHMTLDRKEEARKPKPKKLQKKSKTSWEYGDARGAYRKPRKKRKSLMSKVFEEALDVLEDIFD